MTNSMHQLPRSPGGRTTRTPPSAPGAALALTLISLLLLAVGVPAAAAPGSGRQDSELERLRRRVASLEERIATLEAEYGERMEALESRMASLLAEEAAAGEADADDAEGAVEPRAATEAEPAVRAEAGQDPAEAEQLGESERKELEAELAAALGESEGDEGGGEAAGRLPASAPDGTGSQRRFTGRTRNLSELNPEISVTGDLFGKVSDRTGSPETNQFRFTSFELSMQSALDPFSMAKAFVVHEEGEFELEEAYIDWTSLPAGLGLKVGKFRQDWGTINRWHQHALPQVDRPFVHQAFWGEGGLLGLGASVSWTPTPFLGDYNEVIVQVTNDDNDVAFSGRGFDEPVFTVHERNYFDLSKDAYLEVGLSASTGVNDPLGQFRTQVYGVDWNFDWRPPARALYTGLEVRGELMWERRETEVGVFDSLGAYTYGTYRLDRQWLLGIRGDWTELPEEPGESLWGVSPYIEWWQSEWARMRFQYTHASRLLEEPEDENRFFFQITWALGPHKHEKY